MPTVSLVRSSVLPMQDLQHAIDLSPETDAKAECHTEQGMIYQKMHDFAQAIKDLKQVCKHNRSPQNTHFEQACHADLPPDVNHVHAAMLLSVQDAWSPHACITVC